MHRQGRVTFTDLTNSRHDCLSENRNVSLTGSYGLCKQPKKYPDRSLTSSSIAGCMWKYISHALFGSKVTSDQNVFNFLHFCTFPLCSCNDWWDISGLKARHYQQMWPVFSIWHNVWRGKKEEKVRQKVHDVAAVNSPKEKIPVSLLHPYNSSALFWI